MVAIPKLALIVLALVVLLVVLTGETGLFSAVKEGVQGSVSSVNVSFGASETIAEKPVLQGRPATSINSLTKTISTILESPDENCFLNYGGLVPLGDTSLFLTTAGEGATLTVTGGAGGKQKVSETSFPGMKLCVIATGKVADNFRESWLVPGEIVKKRYTRLVSQITISYDTPLVGSDGNRINYGEGDEDLEDKGWLFKGGNNEICFFPTSGTGLNRDSLPSDDTIPSHISLCRTEYDRITIIYRVFDEEGNPQHITATLGFNEINNEWSVAGTIEHAFFSALQEELDFADGEEGVRMLRNYEVPSPGHLVEIKGLSGLGSFPNIIRKDMGAVGEVNFIYDRSKEEWMYSFTHRDGDEGSWGYVKNWEGPGPLAVIGRTLFVMDEDEGTSFLQQDVVASLPLEGVDSG